jgi:hypothetical protein
VIAQPSTDGRERRVGDYSCSCVGSQRSASDSLCRFSGSDHDGYPAVRLPRPGSARNRRATR